MFGDAVRDLLDPRLRGGGGGVWVPPGVHVGVVRTLLERDPQPPHLDWPTLRSMLALSFAG